MSFDVRVWLMRVLPQGPSLVSWDCQSMRDTKTDESSVYFSVTRNWDHTAPSLSWCFVAFSSLFFCLFVISITSPLLVFVFQSHRRQHNKDKPFKCHNCHRAYTDSSSLEVHLSTHTVKHAKVYTCSICSRAYTSVRVTMIVYGCDLLQYFLLHAWSSLMLWLFASSFL